MYRVVVVDGTSMTPTFQHGDSLVVGRAPFHKGDVVVATVADGARVVKRVTSVEGGWVHLMGDNPLSDSYTIRTQDVMGRQLLPALATWRFLGSWMSGIDEALETQESLSGMPAFDRGGWVWLGAPYRKARKLMPGRAVGWAGQDLVLVSGGYYWICNAATKETVRLGPEANKHVWAFTDDVVAFEDRGFTWKVDSSLSPRPLWRGFVYDCSGGRVRGVRVGRTALEFVKYDSRTGQERVESSIPRQAVRERQEVDVLQLVRTEEAMVTGGPTSFDKQRLFDGRVDTPDSPEHYAGWKRPLEVTFRNPIVLSGCAFSGLFTQSWIMEVAKDNSPDWVPACRRTPGRLQTQLDFVSPVTVTRVRFLLPGGDKGMSTPLCSDIRLLGVRGAPSVHLTATQPASRRAGA